MLFHSVKFLQLFALTFAVYWLLRNQRARMVALLLASIYFYARWNPWLVFLVIGTALFDYWIAIRIEESRDPRARRALLVASLCVTLGLLAFWKYTNFAVATLWPSSRRSASARAAPVFDIVLPLGISFYTFETVSYVVDVYRGRLRAERKLLDYALFLLFFPHLIAGPIVRPADFLPQLRVLQRWDWTEARARRAALRAGLHQEGGDRRPARAPGRSGLRRAGGLLERRAVGGDARLHAADLLRLLGLHRHGARLRARVRPAPARRTSTCRTSRRTSPSSGAAGT